MTKQVAIVGAGVMTTLLALMVAWQFRLAVLYVLISLALAAALRPLVNRLAGQRFVVRLGWILLSLVVFGGVLYLLFQSARIAIIEIQDLVQTVLEQDEWILPFWLRGSLFQQVLINPLPLPSKLFEGVVDTQGRIMISALFGFTMNLAAVVKGMTVILLLSLYWMISQTHFERLWLSLLAAPQRKQARDIWRNVEPEVGAYIRGQIGYSLLAGVVLGLGYWALGSPYPVFLAWIGALASVIPVLGVPLALVAPLLVGLLASIPVPLGFLTAIYTLIVLIALGVYVRPLIFGRRRDNPILILVVLVALTYTMGIIGVILAPLISVILQILWELLVSYRLTSGAAVQVSDLKARQESIWVTIREMDELHMPLLTSSMERLARLIEKAEPILEESLADQPSTSSFSLPPEAE